MSNSCFCALPQPSVRSPVSLQLSAVLSEGRPQVPGVPRGVVAHSSGSLSHDAFCRQTPERLELLELDDGRGWGWGVGGGEGSRCVRPSHLL